MKRLTIIQLCMLLVAAFIPQFEGMFTWVSHDTFVNFGKESMSLSNLMTVQQIGVGPIIYWIFYIMVVLTMIVYTSQLFFQHELLKTKITMVPSIISFLLCNAMIISAATYRTTYTYYGKYRSVSVQLEILGWFELTIFALIILIDLYKHFKLVN